MAEIDPKEKQKLVDLVELLGSIKGRHTELVTVYIPAGFNVNQVAKQIDDEKGTAISDNSRRKNRSFPFMVGPGPRRCNHTARASPLPVLPGLV